MNGRWRLATLTCLGVLASALGCANLNPNSPTNTHYLKEAVFPAAPKELQKTVLPPYIIEPPDILVIEATQILPKAPYQLRPLDVIAVEASGVLPELPIAGAFRVEPNGMVNLGVQYGSVRVQGYTVDQAQRAIQDHLAIRYREPKVTTGLLEMATMQQVLGDHLVGPDGAVTLGVYGKVPVVGLTIEQARFAIERHLSQFLESPQVSVDVFAYNSKVYYVITEGAGLGDQVARFPITGNETVLDAISNVSGLSQLSSKRIWIARPTPDRCNVQILPVDWKAITAHGVTETNYQVLPGDRVFIAEHRMVAADNHLAKAFSPFERIFGFTILGVRTASLFKGNVLGNTGFGGGGVQ